VKLLLDENTSYRTLKAINEHFPGSVHVNSAGTPLRSDMAIWQYARNNGFIIVTFDTDFVQIATLRGAPPHVVLLQLRNPSYKEVARVLIERKVKIDELVGDASPDASAVLEIRA
jgi:predicted nuclease of predicted toxin-antitoxin system